MFLDAQLSLASSQAVTSTAVSTNTIDLSPMLSAQRNIGAGQSIYVVIRTMTTATAAGAATVDFQVVTDTAANLGTATIAQSTGAIAKTALTAGSQLIVIPVPPTALKRYLGVNFAVATGPLTAGAFSVDVVLDPQVWQAYKRNYTV
jgi:hypothetical protein